MNNRKLVTSLVAAFLLAVLGLFYLIQSGGPALGLDLQGGISAIYSPVFEDDQRPEDFDAVLDETISVIRERIDSLGVAEPEISRQGDDVLVQLPGLEDPERAQELIGTTAELTFRKVKGVLDPRTAGEAYTSAPECDAMEPLSDTDGGFACGPTDGSDLQTKYLLGPKALGGDAITGARAELDPSGGWGVAIEFDGPGGAIFAQLTGELACDRDALMTGGTQPEWTGAMAIVLDDVVYSAPGMNPNVACGVGIQGGSGSISVGAGTQDEQIAEAQNLALVLKTGSLPITLQASTFETVSPSLGEASLNAGLLAGLIGLALVALYLIGIYRWMGAVAILGLLVFGIYLVSVVTLLGQVGFSLTLAGIAGMIVSLGIAADSSILYFERVRDEVGEGKTVRTAVIRGFDSAFRTNLAGNTVTFAASAILYFLAVGPVRGFALTLGIATLLDLCILWLYTRPMIRLMGQRKLLSKESLRIGRSSPLRRSTSRPGSEKEAAL